LFPENELVALLNGIKNDSVKTWEEVHRVYKQNSKRYEDQKLEHAYSCLLEILSVNELSSEQFKNLLIEAIETKNWMTQNIRSSREKDYQSDFKQMVYDNEAEMIEVVGSLKDNVFINEQESELASFTQKVKEIIAAFSL
jgi:hypothetical protein